jgi:hypothetical protein
VVRVGVVVTVANGDKTWRRVLWALIMKSSGGKGAMTMVISGHLPTGVAEGYVFICLEVRLLQLKHLYGFGSHRAEYSAGSE